LAPHRWLAHVSTLLIFLLANDMHRNIGQQELGAISNRRPTARGHCIVTVKWLFSSLDIIQQQPAKVEFHGSRSVWWD